MPKNKNKDLTYEPEVLDNELEKELKKMEKRSFKTLTEQIETEYQLCWWYMKPKFEEWGLRLKLYNNQKRDKTAIGDPLLFTIHQSVLASLYSDRLTSEFLPRERGDVEVAENLTLMSEYDYWEMLTPIVDYAWDWDAGFFGRGLVLMQEFDRTMQVPVMENIDPMTFLRDPRAVSVNGNMKGANAMRFGGWECRMTKNEMKNQGVYFNLDKLGKADNDVNSLTDANSRARQDAQGYNNIESLKQIKGENQEYRVLRWYTMWKGKRVMVWLANNRKAVIRYAELPNRKIPIIDRAIYPMAHDWDGVSIPDLIEDKQRARAVIQNLGLKTVKAGLNPMYLFDSNRIKNKGDLNYGHNKHIGVDGKVDGAVQEIQRAGLKSEVSFILDVLDKGAERATATPEMQQGAMSEEKRTATETNLIDAKVGKRYSLTAKVFGWSEKLRWLQYYDLYKENFEEGIDEKMLRINGALGFQWRPLTRENIITDRLDPDVKIESKVLAEAERMNTMQRYQNYINLALTFPSANKLFALREFGKLSGLDRDIVNNILPPTIDEMQAEMENKKLSANNKVRVLPTDDDQLHMSIHNKVEDIPAKYAHIEAHKRAMVLKKQNPDMFPQPVNNQVPSEEVLAKMSSSAKPTQPVKSN